MRTPDAPYYYYFESEHSFDIAKWFPEQDRVRVIKLRASIWWKWEESRGDLTKEELEHSGELSYKEAEEVAKAMVAQLNAEYRKEQKRTEDTQCT